MGGDLSDGSTGDVANRSETTGKELINIGAVRGLIYRVRGREVVLDADLARIYGYETKKFNQQVKRNMEKFEGRAS